MLGILLYFLSLFDIFSTIIAVNLHPELPFYVNWIINSAMSWCCYIFISILWNIHYIETTDVIFIAGILYFCLAINFERIKYLYAYSEKKNYAQSKYIANDPEETDEHISEENDDGSTNSVVIHEGIGDDTEITHDLFPTIRQDLIKLQQVYPHEFGPNVDE